MKCAGKAKKAGSNGMHKFWVVSLLPKNGYCEWADVAVICLGVKRVGWQFGIDLLPVSSNVAEFELLSYYNFLCKKQLVVENWVSSQVESGVRSSADRKGIQILRKRSLFCLEGIWFCFQLQAAWTTWLWLSIQAFICFLDQWLCLGCVIIC